MNSEASHSIEIKKRIIPFLTIDDLSDKLKDESFLNNYERSMIFNYIKKRESSQEYLNLIYNSTNIYKREYDDILNNPIMKEITAVMNVYVDIIKEDAIKNAEFRRKKIIDNIILLNEILDSEDIIYDKLKLKQDKELIQILKEQVESDALKCNYNYAVVMSVIETSVKEEFKPAFSREESAFFNALYTFVDDINKMVFGEKPKTSILIQIKNRGRTDLDNIYEKYPWFKDQMLKKKKWL